MTGEFSDAALVLLGHGSTVNADSAAPTHQHADELRRRGAFAQVLTGFWKEHPAFSGVLRGVHAPRVFVVPLFISDGYFTEEVIPRELGLAGRGQTEFPRIQQRAGRKVHYCGPVGTHARMTDVILARAREVVGSGPDAPSPADCSLFIAGHGTGNNENSRRAIEDQVRFIRTRGIYHDVHPLFMEEDPRIAEAYTLAETGHVIVVPFFISDGLHSYEDIPVMLGAPAEAVQERFRRGEPTWINPTDLRGKRVWYSRSIGMAPMMADVVMDRVRESAAATVV
ncbi:MAG: cobalamin biosynthesis protein CbiX [Proteobacteria bacterium]|nr:cobalamin biosynthesis protein CbiX [Pseudomonadota bacterium]